MPAALSRSNLPHLSGDRESAPAWQESLAFGRRSHLQSAIFRLVAILERRSRRLLMTMICVLVGVVSVVDYLTGYEITFSLFYLGAVALSTWFIGWRFALGISIVSLVLGFTGDLLAGATKEKLFMAIWNEVLAFGSYLIVVIILSTLRSLQLHLERKVTERTAALTDEMAKRQHLEKEILGISEREQRRIGHDLHDTLCQHLTATTIACEVMRERLERKGQPEAVEAQKAISLIREGITLARDLARGLAPVALEAEGLMEAFREMAKTTRERFRIECRFECIDPVLIHDSAIAIHLFRIAQEAMSNAIRHGGASSIAIVLSSDPDKIRLQIRDNGCGMDSPKPGHRGMGLHIMKHRAQMIGGEIVFKSSKSGTVITCALPVSADAP